MTLRDFVDEVVAGALDDLVDFDVDAMVGGESANELDDTVVAGLDDRAVAGLDDAVLGDSDATLEGDVDDMFIRKSEIVSGSISLFRGGNW